MALTTLTTYSTFRSRFFIGILVSNAERMGLNSYVRGECAKASNCPALYDCSIFVCRWLEKDKCKPLYTYLEIWLRLGVTYVGGCCRTYAEDINDIRAELTKLKP